MNDNNYYTVQGWMINRLKLSGNDLIVYAIIYGFSQDSKSKFKGSCQYLADSVGVSKRSIIRILQKLVEKGYLQKLKSGKNGLKCFDYRVLNTGEESSPVTKCHQTGDKMSPPPVTKCHQTGDKMSPHINIINISHNDLDNIGGSAEPQEPKKLPLRQREPVNDMERVEKAYLLNWDTLFLQRRVQTEKPVVKWDQTRKLLKTHLQNITADQIIQAVNAGMTDDFILDGGYSLGVMLSASVLNRLINTGRKAAPKGLADKESLSGLATLF